VQSQVLRGGEVTRLSFILAVSLLACCGCASPDESAITADTYVANLDGRDYTIEQLAREIYELRRQLQEEKDKQVPPATVCSCKECKCESEATYQDIREGWTRLCQCDKAKSRPAPAVEHGPDGPKLKATLVEIKDVQLKPREKPPAKPRNTRYPGALNP
jgi:hypothetical protein